MFTFEKFLLEWTIVPGLNGIKHHRNDVFKVAGDFNSVAKFGLVIGSHSRNPNGTTVLLPKGYEIVFDEEAPDGHVWFTFINPNTKKQDRGYTMSGSLKNMLEAGYIISK